MADGVVFEIIRPTNDKFKSDLPVRSAIVAIMGAMAIITDLIGVHTVLGAFVAGIGIKVSRNARKHTHRSRKLSASHLSRAYRQGQTQRKTPAGEKASFTAGNTVRERPRRPS
ncbi:hypothetical protein RHECNPAF_9300129 [Rhizobium etli CNPAF512]|nr:hypothetical protein RHECNPAF_9300129 [Rhizobium etli CNPAF512]